MHIAAGLLAAALLANPAILPHPPLTPPRDLVVGDSLSYSARGYLRDQGFSVNARPGRKMSAAPSILKSYGSRLPPTVVVALAVNGRVRLSTCKSVVKIAGPHRVVVLVNGRSPRRQQAANNHTLRLCDRSFAPGRVRLANWYAYSKGHPEWFLSDRTHLTKKGKIAYSRLIRKVAGERR